MRSLKEKETEKTSMKSLKGTQTETSLLTAFVGESQARNRYTFFASKARKEGFVQIALVFEETANQEKEHAERFWDHLEGGECEVKYTFPAGFSGELVGTTLENLKHAAEGERYEHTTMYPGFADIAEKEGFPQVAATFRNIAKAEMFHEERYVAFAKNIEKDRVFKRDKEVTWRCINCSYRHVGKEAPKTCPACKHPQSYYEIINENW